MTATLSVATFGREAPCRAGPAGLVVAGVAVVVSLSRRRTHTACCY